MYGFGCLYSCYDCMLVMLGTFISSNFQGISLEYSTLTLTPKYTKQILMKLPPAPIQLSCET